MKNLNQLVCVTLLLSCAQAYRSYIRAQTPASKSSQQVNVMNGTNWNMVVRYTTPAGLITTDAIGQNSSKSIELNPKDPVTYSLSKERAQTETHAMPLADIQKGVFQLTTEMIKDLIAPFIQAAATTPTTPATIVSVPLSMPAPANRQGPAIPAQTGATPTGAPTPQPTK